MKKYNKYDALFQNYNLTELLVYKKGNRKGLAAKTSVSTMTDRLLNPYGINLWYHWTGLEGLVLRGCSINKDFPAVNFPIIVQMYGWLDSDIYICLERTEDCEYGFYYNTEKETCKLVEYRWGEIKKEKLFDNFYIMWSEVKKMKNKYYEIL